MKRIIGACLLKSVLYLNEGEMKKAKYLATLAARAMDGERRALRELRLICWVSSLTHRDKAEHYSANKRIRWVQTLNDLLIDTTAEHDLSHGMTFPKEVYV